MHSTPQSYHRPLSYPNLLIKVQHNVSPLMPYKPHCRRQNELEFVSSCSQILFGIFKYSVDKVLITVYYHYQLSLEESFFQYIMDSDNEIYLSFLKSCSRHTDINFANDVRYTSTVVSTGIHHVCAKATPCAVMFCLNPCQCSCL